MLASQPGRRAHPTSGWRKSGVVRGRIGGGCRSSGMVTSSAWRAVSRRGRCRRWSRTRCARSVTLVEVPMVRTSVVRCTLPGRPTSPGHDTLGRSECGSSHPGAAAAAPASTFRSVCQCLSQTTRREPALKHSLSEWRVSTRGWTPCFRQPSSIRRPASPAVSRSATIQPCDVAAEDGPE